MKRLLLLGSSAAGALLFASSASAYFAEDFAVTESDFAIQANTSTEDGTASAATQKVKPYHFFDDHPLTRAEFAVYLMSQDTYQAQIDHCYRDITSTFPPSFTLVFTDVHTEDTFAPYICLGMKEGIITYGPSQAFRPNDLITITEAATMLSRYFELAPYAHMNTARPWYEEYLMQLSQKKSIPSSVSTLQHVVTAEEATMMIQALMHKRALPSYNTFADTDGNGRPEFSTSHDEIMPLSGIHHVRLKTSLGDIDLEIDAEETPKTATNFIELGKRGYYDGLTFHRVIPGFMIQGGDPAGNGTGGESIYGATFENEPSDDAFVRGVIAMANRGPDTNGSQFFIVTAKATPWLKDEHTIFGRVTAGMDVVDAIAERERDERDMPIVPITMAVEILD